MNQFIVDNELGRGISKCWNLKHLKVIERHLNPNENVLVCFIGLHNYESSGKNNHNFAYAITDSRFIMGQKKVIGVNVQTVLRKNLNDVTKSTGMIFGVITFDTIREKFKIGVDSSTIDRIHNLINETFFHEEPKQEEPDYVAQLTQLKDLVDSGILTDEEFNLKKQEILEKM